MVQSPTDFTVHYFFIYSREHSVCLGKWNAFIPYFMLSRYQWYAIFISDFHDIQYLFLVSVIQSILFSFIHDIQYLWMVSMILNINVSLIYREHLCHFSGLYRWFYRFRFACAVTDFVSYDNIYLSIYDIDLLSISI